MGFTPPFLEVRKISSTSYSVYAPQSTAGSSVKIYPNTTDATPYIQLNPNGNILLICKGGSYITFQDALVGNILRTSFTDPDCIWESTIADKNLYFKVAGTGKVKFGTHTAQADTPITGYIDILDAAGNARKLAVISP